MPKTIYQRIFDLREWQKEDFNKWLESVNSGRKDFLTVATPGAGKTKSALRKAHYLLEKNIVDRIVVVTYTEYLKRQWAKEAALFAGIDLDPDFVNSQGQEASDYHGISMTYALLGQDKTGVHAQNSFHKRTFLIVDEVHHAGENLTWGDALKKSFDSATFRLALSGTPFRSDDCQIPFITYEDGISKADYTYSYERAIRENVCRPIYFNVYGGKMKWKVEAAEFQASFDDYLTPDQAARRLRTALEANSNYVKHVVTEAHIKLMEIRKTHTDAAGLFTCIDQAHAKKVMKVFDKNIGIKPLLVISDEGEGKKRIEEFANSTDPWIVSVKMVSEGVDIPRLRVGGLLTNVKTKMYFRQFVGRFVRVLQTLQTQYAYVFIPQDKDIVKLAENIQDEVNHALLEAKRKAGGSGGSVDTDLFGNETNYVEALKGKYIPLGADATDFREISVNININSGMKSSVVRTVSDDDPVYLRKEHLRSKLNQLAKRVALHKRNGNSNIKPDFKIAHRMWIDAGGKSMEKETIPELERREDFYRKLLGG